jgi:hypothetical protein
MPERHAALDGFMPHGLRLDLDLGVRYAGDWRRHSIDRPLYHLVSRLRSLSTHFTNMTAATQTPSNTHVQDVVYIHVLSLASNATRLGLSVQASEIPPRIGPELS